MRMENGDETALAEHWCSAVPNSNKNGSMRPCPLSVHYTFTLGSEAMDGGTAGDGGTGPPQYFSTLSITPIGVAWNESTSNGSRSPNRRAVAPPLRGAASEDSGPVESCPKTKVMTKFKPKLNKTKVRTVYMAVHARNVTWPEMRLVGEPQVVDDISWRAPSTDRGAPLPAGGRHH